MIDIDQRFIRQVNELAIQSAEKGFDPFAAILVKEGQVVAHSLDQCIQQSDPTAHAELALISTFCRANQLISLEGYTLYCNVEPCVMCSGAIHWARLSRVVFGVRQQKLQKVSQGKPKPDCDQLINIGRQKTEVIGPVLEEEGFQVLLKYPFQSKKDRHKHYWSSNR